MILKEKRSNLDNLFQAFPGSSKNFPVWGNDCVFGEAEQSPEEAVLSIILN